MIEGKEAFEQFWQAYPPERHTQRSAARMSFDIAFHSLITEHGSAAAAMAFLLERVNRYLRSPLATKENRKYCLNPKRFIDERRWEDADEAWGYKRKAYVGTPIAQRLVKELQAPREAPQNVLEALHGADVDAMSDDEVVQLLSPTMRRMYAQRGKTGTIRDVLLKEISERARKE